MGLSSADAAHLLRRTGFGAAPSTIAALQRKKTRLRAVDSVLDLRATPADDLGALSDENFGAEWWRVTTWWLERMRTSPVPIVERMTLFWHDHFVSATDKCRSMRLLGTQHRVFREHALGNFHELAQAIAVDPAMLVYLDNWLNVSAAPQENFARELMELFTVGQGHYSEDDVRSMARAWTGHSLSGDYLSHTFYPHFHDDGDKSLFGLPPRRWTGPETLTEILRGALAVPSSRFIAAKVFSHLAYPVDPDDPAVGPIADEFRRSGLDILHLVRTILRSDQFWSDRARHALVRSPIEWFVAGLQAIDVPIDRGLAMADVFASGQIPFGHPGVDGWGANEHWISTASQWSRSSWAAKVRVVAYFDGVFAGFDELAAADAVDRALQRFGIVDVSEGTRSALVAWVDRSHAEGDAAVIPMNLVLLVLLCPEFQVS